MKHGIGIDEGYAVSAKAMLDWVLQDAQARIAADRELRSKLEDIFLGREQDLSAIRTQALQTGQVHNAVINAALVESMLGRTLEETIEGKLASAFPASVTEMVTSFTEKLMNMVGVDAVLAIVEAAAAKAKADIQGEQ